MQQWVNVKVRYNKTMEDGQTKKVAESYLVDALCFSEAEKRIAEELEYKMSSDYEINAVKKSNFAEVVFDKQYGDYWYKAKVYFVTINEVTQKEKKSAVYYLVNASSFDRALTIVNGLFGGTMIDYRVASISETNILDVFKHEEKQKKEG